MFLIIGGTGTLGRELTKQLLDKGHKVIVGSRCELKQKEMRDEFKSDRLSFALCDVRDPDSLNRVFMRGGIKVVFHVAALKQVDTLEGCPEEAMKTNVLGTINVANACSEHKVDRCIFSSTDKAVGPVNAYGASKCLAEKILFARNSESRSYCTFSVYRWGNILGSRGSALKGFVETIRKEKKAYVTDFGMTRFWLKIEDAASYMIETYSQAALFAPMIPKCKAADVMSLICGIGNILRIQDIDFVETGIRPGEKIHESLNETLNSETAEQFSNQELEAFIRPAVEALL